MELAIETDEAEKRIKVLKEETRLEGLRKEELDLERELYELTRPSIFQWIIGLFKKGGNKNANRRTEG